MQHPPKFVTFTGADDLTDISRMQALSSRFPIEWGILLSPSRQGQGRYPSLKRVTEILVAGGLRLAAHLCGGHSRDVLSRGASDVDAIVAGGFQRAQINTSVRQLDLDAIRGWADRQGVSPILQCIDGFPASTEVSWLFDRSGGNGVAPSEWPAAHPGAMCGYAGGIGPSSVGAVLAAISASNFWLDMETRVRDENDRFDLDLCERVCELVFGSANGLPRNDLAEVAS